MKERPILFSAPMVRAILEGRKTQTRRVVKPQLDLGLYLDWQEMDAFEGKARFRRVGPDYPDTEGDDGIVCPYGALGGRLWVRETWAIRWYQGGWHVYFDADGEHSRRDEVGAFPLGKGRAGRLRPSIHMPRWASRITLEVTGVRVERLQDISEADAIAEGLLRDKDGWRGAPDLPWFASPVAAYRSLWESINGAGSWDANPRVWVVEFSRIEQEAKAA